MYAVVRTELVERIREPAIVQLVTIGVVCSE